jgi:copper oxidase (laccase) domain-containing protein
VVVSHPGDHAGAEADAAVTAVPGAALAVQTADCAPLALTADGVVGVVHVGWRGLLGGVVEAAVGAMRGLGATEIRAELGPCIRARCYEFGADDLEPIAARAGDSVRGRTASGAPGLELAAGISAVLAGEGVSDLIDQGVCTACSPNHWSYRSRGDTARQAVVAWLEP